VNTNFGQIEVELLVVYFQVSNKCLWVE